MSGGLVIDGFENYFPILKDLPERFLFIKHVEHTEGEIISINGLVKPVMAIRSGEVQFWRIAHIGATLFIKFRIEGDAALRDRHGRSSFVPSPATDGVLHRTRSED